MSENERLAMKIERCEDIVMQERAARLAAESRAARLLAALREIAWHELPVGTAMDAIFQDIARRAIAAEEGK